MIAWNRHTRWIPAALMAAALASPVLADARLEQRVQDATQVYRELMQTPDRSVPETLLKDCRCVAVIPRVLKGAMGYGARYGHGVITCRNAAGAWSPISFLTLTGGSVGFQIGAERSDFVLFFMTDRGARSLIESKFTLGGKVSVAAGPAGRSAEASTDIKLDAEIYTYAKSRGLFAGVSLEGARLAPDTKANREYYGSRVSADSLLFGRHEPKSPPASQEFRSALP
jgi:lipid-binding SYLF domain-containing protein